MLSLIDLAEASIPNVGTQLVSIRVEAILELQTLSVFDQLVLDVPRGSCCRRSFA